MSNVLIDDDDDDGNKNPKYFKFPYAGFCCVNVKVCFFRAASLFARACVCVFRYISTLSDEYIRTHTFFLGALYHDGRERKKKMVR